MSTPFGSGVAALYLQRDPTMTPTQVRVAMQADGSAGVVLKSGTNSPNILLSTAKLISTAPVAAPVAGPAFSPISAPVPAPVVRTGLAPARGPQTCYYFLETCGTAGIYSCCIGKCRWSKCLLF